jgi:hypothetical protein
MRWTTTMVLALAACTDPMLADESDLSACPQGVWDGAEVWVGGDEGQAPIPPRRLTLTSSANPIPGQPLTLTATGANPGEEVVFVRTTQGVGRGNRVPFLGDLRSGLRGPILDVGSATAGPNGEASLTVTTPATLAPGQSNVFLAAVRRGRVGRSSIISNNLRLTVTDGSARVRVVHASPDAPPVDIYLNGALAIPDLAYGEATDLTPVGAGAAVAEVRPAGAPPTSAAVLTAPLILSAEVDTTVAAVGLLGSSSPAASLRLIAFDHGFGSPEWPTARVRVVHAGADAPAVDLDVGDDGSVELPGVPRFAESGPEGVALPGQGFPLRITDPVSGFTTSFQVPAFGRGDEVFVFATGLLASASGASDGFGLLAVGRNNVAFIRPDPVVYALHASPGAPDVDVRVGGATLVAGLPYGALSGPVQVPPGAYDLDIVGLTPGGEVDVGTFGTPVLEPGGNYLAVAAGVVGGTPSFRLLALEVGDDDLAAPVLDAVHASPDAGPVDVGLIDANGFSTLFPNFQFGEARGPLGVLSGTFTFGVAPAGSGTPIAVFPPLPFGADTRVWAIATGRVGIDLGLTVVDTAAQPWTATFVPAGAPQP